MTHRDKIKEYKFEKLKRQNLQDQHQWKLKTMIDKNRKAIHTNNNIEQRRLVNQY